MTTKNELVTIGLRLRIIHTCINIFTMYVHLRRYQKRKRLLRCAAAAAAAAVQTLVNVTESEKIQCLVSHRLSVPLSACCIYDGPPPLIPIPNTESCETEADGGTMKRREIVGLALVFLQVLVSTTSGQVN